jgi:hypothetical protein
MPQLANNNKLLYTVRYSQAGQIFMNTLVYDYLDSFGVTDDYATFAGAWLSDQEAAGGYIARILPNLNNTITIVDHRMQLIYPGRFAPSISTVNSPGGVGTFGTPTNVAMTFTKRTGMATRWGIGSWHLPGLNVVDLDSVGAWNAATVSAIGLDISVPLNGTHTPTGQNGNITAVLWSPDVPLRSTPITSFVGQLTPRVMRRRTVGLGI